MLVPAPSRVGDTPSWFTLPMALAAPSASAKSGSGDDPDRPLVPDDGLVPVGLVSGAANAMGRVNQEGVSPTGDGPVTSTDGRRSGRTGTLWAGKPEPTARPSDQTTPPEATLGSDPGRRGGFRRSRIDTGGIEWPGPCR